MKTVLITGATDGIYQDAIFDTMAICAKVPKMP